LRAVVRFDTGLNLSKTLGIFKVLQVVGDQLHLIVSYENGPTTRSVQKLTPPAPVASRKTGGL
jgi:hypothetical protein